MFSRSTDCGSSWSNPVPLSSSDTTGHGLTVGQGATIAVAPTTGRVYVAWRQFQNATVDCVPGGLGYWKNTAGAWPVASIVVGGVTYTRAPGPRRPENGRPGAMPLPFWPNSSFRPSSTSCRAPMNDSSRRDHPGRRVAVGSSPGQQARSAAPRTRDSRSRIGSRPSIKGRAGPGPCTAAATPTPTPSWSCARTTVVRASAPHCRSRPSRPSTRARPSTPSGPTPTRRWPSTRPAGPTWPGPRVASRRPTPTPSPGTPESWSRPRRTAPPGPRRSRSTSPRCPATSSSRPSTYNAGKLFLVYNDYRADASRVFERFVVDLRREPPDAPHRRHACRHREPGRRARSSRTTPSCKPSSQVSRYPFIVTGYGESDADEPAAPVQPA